MLVTVIVFVVVSVVVGVIAKMLNGLAEANAVRRAEEERRARAARMERAARARGPPKTSEPNASRPAARPRDRDDDGPRTSNPDMDRFLAEIDRLRRKATNQNQSAQPGAAAPVTPVVQPSKPRPANRPLRGGGTGRAADGNGCWPRVSAQARRPRSVWLRSPGKSKNFRRRAGVENLFCYGRTGDEGNQIYISSAPGGEDELRQEPHGDVGIESGHRDGGGTARNPWSGEVEAECGEQRRRPRRTTTRAPTNNGTPE